MTFDVPSLLVLAALMFLLAGFVKGVIGMGLPTVAMGLLSLAMAPAQAAALMVAPSLVTNLWQMLAGPGLMPLLRRFWPMMLWICVGTWAGAGLLSSEQTGSANLALGMAVMLFAVLGLAAARARLPHCAGLRPRHAMGRGPGTG